MSEELVLSALTSPYDRKYATSTVASNRHEPLTQEQTNAAVAALTTTYPQLDRYYKDPVYANQVYCLHSFIPTKNAKPDEHGLYGFVKCRGTFSSLAEANERSEYIIRNMDSYHKIVTNHCGQPFPLCSESDKYAAEIQKVDMKKEMTKTISENVKQKRMEEKLEIEEMKEREKKLLARNKEIEDGDYKEDPIEVYITNRVKLANQIWTYHTTMKKMEDLKNNIRKTKTDIDTMDRESSEYRASYYERYMEARRSSGLDQSENLNTEENFMKYMCEDLDLSFLD